MSFFIDSNASGANNGTSWTDAYADIQTALATEAAGADGFIAQNHSKTYTGDQVFSNNGTITNPITITCVDTTTGAITTGAVEQTTGSGDSLNFHQNGVIYKGVIFKSGDTITSAADTLCKLFNTNIELSTNSSDSINLSGDDILADWTDVFVKFANTNQAINIGAGTTMRWFGGGIDPAGTAVVSPLKFLISRGSKSIFVGLDLTNVTSSVITLPSQINQGIHEIVLLGCKIPSGVPLVDSYTFSSPNRVVARSCDNSDGFYYFEEISFEGYVTQDTVNYLNATYDGTNGYSAKMVSNTNSLDGKRPLRFMLSEFYSAANPTLTIELVTDDEILQNDEFWVEVEYPDSTDLALRKIDDSLRQTVGWSGGSGPGTPANLTTSTASWTETLTSATKQKITTTISGGSAGQHRVFVCLAKPSITVYVDPKVTIS